MKKVSILIPVYNEQNALAALFERLKTLMDFNSEYEWEVMMINDGSVDASLAIIVAMCEKDSRFHYIDLSRNYGKETALLAGFDNVTGDCTVIMDADLQHPPEVIPSMLRKWQEGYDDVYGRRINNGRKPWLRSQLTAIYYRILQKSSSMPIMPDVGDFRLLDRSCVNALTKLREAHRYTKGMYSYIGFRKTPVPYEQADRVRGTSKWGFAKLFSLAVEGITSYTTAPLRFASILGFIVSVCSVLYMLYVVIKTILIGDDVQGFPTLLTVMLFLGGVQLLTLGIMGEYIGRIFNETKHRPVYFIREKDDEHYVDSASSR